MSETWIDWRVIFEEDKKRPGFKEGYEAAKRKIEADEAAGRLLDWEEVFPEERSPKNAKRGRISLLKILGRKPVKPKHFAKVAQI